MDIRSTHELTPAAEFKKHNFDFLNSFLMRLLKLDKINNLDEVSKNLEGIAFIDSVLKQLNISFEIDAAQIKNIPATGAFIAVSNHPYGSLDGLLMLKILAMVRPDFRMMANEMLTRIKNIDQLLIPVNPFKTNNHHHIPGMRKALTYVYNDMPIGIFPAGEVSNLPTVGYKIMDPEWQPAVGRFICKARVPVLPVYFSGNNRISLNILGLLHPLVGTTKIPDELIKKKGHTIKVRIGKPISYQALHALPEADLLPYLRAKTYALGAGFLKTPSLASFPKLPAALAPVLSETSPQLIKADITKLPSSGLLFTHQQYEVYLAAYSQIPYVMREIGRLREITFRLVGEGSGLETDLDPFDQHYHHLFVYDARANLLVGAYRLGIGKEICKQYGKKGFYLHTLFKIRNGFMPVLRQSVELGRYFVRPGYQKKTLPQLLLWKGIATFLEGKNNYRYLLGPVSISHYFPQTSKVLLVDFITEHFYDHELATCIKTRKKFRYRFSKLCSEKVLETTIASVKSRDHLLSFMEPKHQGLPVWLQKYLKQNAKIIGFNINPTFSNSLDGYMMIPVRDLPDTAQLLLNRINEATT